MKKLIFIGVSLMLVSLFGGGYVMDVLADGEMTWWSFGVFVTAVAGFFIGAFTLAYVVDHS